MKAFLRAGVALNKTDIFRDVFEEHGFTLAGRRTLSDNIPFIHGQEISVVKTEISKKNIAVVFDGTSRLGEAFAIVVRYVDNFKIEHRLIRLQLLVKSLKGEEIAREVMNTLSTEYGVAGNSLLAAARDRAAANGVAMCTIKIIFPDVLDIGCYLHTLDHVGEHFDTPFLEEFSHSFLTLFSHSPRTSMEWKEFTGRAMATYFDTRWWSRWEVYHQLMVQFVESHDQISSKSRLKLLEILRDGKKKALKLAAVIDVGEIFVKATYNLEGDGLVVLQTYYNIQVLKAKIENPHYPNVDVVAKSVAVRGRTYQQLK